MIDHVARICLVLALGDLLLPQRCFVETVSSSKGDLLPPDLLAMTMLDFSLKQNTSVKQNMNFDRLSI